MSIVPETGILRKLYEEARMQDTVEYASSAFWQTWLQTQFYPNNNHSVVCEYAPGDTSRRRIDITVLKYNPSQHTIMRLILVEAKHARGSTAEVERQALDGACIAIKNYKLAALYAITTIGTEFRTWVVDNRRRTLDPLHGESPAGERGAYIDADSDQASTLLHDLHFIKTEPPLAIAPTLPSQGHLLQPPWRGYASTSQDASTDMHTSGYVDLGATQAEPGTSDVADPTQGADNRKWIQVTLQKKKHLLGKDDLIFSNAKGKSVTTSASDWEKMKMDDGRTVYVYGTSHHIYFSTISPHS